MKRRLLIATAAVLAVLAVLVAGAFVYLDSQAGRSWLAGMLEDAVSEPGVMELKLGPIGPGLPGRITVAAASLADADGVWLEAKDLVIDWDPWSLLSRRLEVSRMEIASLSILRQPLPGPAADQIQTGSAEPFAVPELPVDIAVADLALTRVILGEALLGTAAELDIKAKLDASRAGDIQLGLAVERIDGVGGSLTADADINLGEGQLGLSAKVHEPAGGVVVHLLDLAPYPEFILSLDGEGPASAWSGKLHAEAGELVVIDLAANIGASDTLAVGLDGTAAIAALLPEDLGDIVGPEIGLATEIDVDGPLVTIKHLAVDMLALAVSGEGTVMTEDQTVDIAVALEGRDPEPITSMVQPLELGAWHLDIAALGDMAAPEVTVEGMADAVVLPDVFSGDIALAAHAIPGSSESWHLEGMVDATGAGTSIEAAQTLLGAGPRLTFGLDADAAFQRLSDLSLSLTGDNVDLAVRGDIDLAAFSGAVTLDAEVSDASALSDELGLEVSGGLGLQADLDLDPGLSRAKGTLRLTGDNFAIDQDQVAAFIGRELTVTSEIDSDLATQLALIDLTVKSEAVDLAGSMRVLDNFSIVSGRLDGPLTVTSALASALSLDPVGRAAATLRFAGPLDDPVIRAEARLHDMSVEGVSLDSVTAHAEIRDVAEIPRGEALVALPSPVGEVKVATSFVIEDVDVVVPRLAITGAGIDGRGSLRLDGNDIVTGTLQGEAADIAPLAAMAGLDASGAAKFQVDLATDDTGGQGATVALQGTGLAMPMTDDESVTVGQVRLRAELQDLAGEPSGRADISLGGARYQSYVLEGAVVNATMAGDVVDFELGAQGRAGVAVTVDLGAEVDLAEEDLIMTFSRLDGSLGGKEFAQSGPLRLVFGGDELQVNGLALSMSGGRIEADLRRAPESLDAAIVVKGLPLDVVEIFVPGSALAGTIDGKIDLATSGGVVVGSLNVSANDIDLSEGGGDEGVPADIQVTAQLAATGVEADLVLGGIPGSDIDGHASIGAAIDAESLSVRNAGAAPLDASLSLNARLQSIWDDLPASDQRMRGDLSVELAATGTVGDPRISGQANLVGGSYEHLVYGTLLNDITLNITGDSSHNLAISLNANDGGTGTVAAEGQIALGDEAAVAATLTFRNATLVRRDDVTASASGDIRYDGSFLEGAIAGTVTTETIEVSLVNTLPVSVVVLDVTNVFDAGARDQAASSSGLWSATLDVAIDMPRRVFVRGRGVDTEWFGHVNIGGTTNNPVIEGKLEIQRGQVSIIGRAFEMTRGIVELDPEQPDNPTIDIVAQNKRQDVTGVITISGRATDPDIEISSTPPLPEAEVLPRVLFGKSASNLSAFEAFELASAVATLSGVGSGGFGLIDRARQTLGVDVLRVGTNDEGATTVGAGSYLTERVYVGVEQGTGSQTGAVKVEVEVTDDISVNTSTGTDASANVGVNWRWDY